MGQFVSFFNESRHDPANARLAGYGYLLLGPQSGRGLRGSLVMQHDPDRSFMPQKAFFQALGPPIGSQSDGSA